MSSVVAGPSFPSITAAREEAYRRARELSWERHGRKIVFFHPAMFRFNGAFGKYPALSITADRCALSCDHCKGRILKPMIAADDPARLLEQCKRLEAAGHPGCLLSGGCLDDGTLPWGRFLDAVRAVKKETRLFISVHAGLLDEATAVRLKEAGVDQALLDVVGDDDTFKRVYHVPFGIERIRGTLAALNAADLPVVPHVVAGIDYGRITGENAAIEMLAGFRIQRLVIVSLMKVPGTPMANLPKPDAFEVADLFARARMRMPDVPLSLGCARERGNVRLEMLAVDCGVNRLALPSDEAVARAREYGLELKYQKTCCSVGIDLEEEGW